MKVVTIVGARPQFIKAAPVSRLLRAKHTEVLVHTGQHYDENMSDVFFEELDIPAPDYHLEVGSGLHGQQTGAMLAEIEKVLLAEKPDWALVYGDTNSTLAGALAASKLHIPVAHVEAGLRSFNRAMPEEINRVLTDHVSDLLFCPSQTAVDNLATEGITRGVYLVGDVMYEALLCAVDRALQTSTVLSRFGLSDKSYILATMHRAENTDNPDHLEEILSALVAVDEVIVFPVHPRTQAALQRNGFFQKSYLKLKLVDPLGYLDMACLISAARLVLTDSGGMQKEAYWLQTPCVTLRDETEWPETVDLGWNQLVGADKQRILVAVAKTAHLPSYHPPLYGDGGAAKRCVHYLEEQSYNRF